MSPAAGCTLVSSVTYEVMSVSPSEKLSFGSSQSYLIETLEEILYPALNLIAGETGGSGVAADGGEVVEGGLHRGDEARGRNTDDGGASDGNSPGGTEESGSEHGDGALGLGGGVGG